MFYFCEIDLVLLRGWFTLTWFVKLLRADLEFLFIHRGQYRITENVEEDDIFSSNSDDMLNGPREYVNQNTFNGHNNNNNYVADNFVQPRMTVNDYGGKACHSDSSDDYAGDSDDCSLWSFGFHINWEVNRLRSRSLYTRDGTVIGLSSASSVLCFIILRPDSRIVLIVHFAESVFLVCNFIDAICTGFFFFK